MLRREGQIFAVKDEAVRSREIRDPENGLSAYMNDARTKYSKLKHSFAKFRDNDILYFPEECEQYLFLS